MQCSVSVSVPTILLSSLPTPIPHSIRTRTDEKYNISPPLLVNDKYSSFKLEASKSLKPKACIDANVKKIKELRKVIRVYEHLVTMHEPTLALVRSMNDKVKENYAGGIPVADAMIPGQADEGNTLAELQFTEPLHAIVSQISASPALFEAAKTAMEAVKKELEHLELLVADDSSEDSS